MDITYRKAEKKDIKSMLSLIKELALYEKAPQEVTNNEKAMLEDGFGANPIFEAFIAEQKNTIIGLALFYISYSTWKGRALYLEDIIVTEKMRRYGIGKKLFDLVVQKAKEINAKRMHWQVLEWNTPAINFYEKIGADLDSEWINCKLTEQQIINYKSERD